MTGEERKYFEEAIDRAATKAAREASEAAKETREAVRELNIMVADLKTDVAELAQGQAKIGTQLDRMESQIQTVAEQHSHLTQRIAKLETGEDNLKDFQVEIRSKLHNHETRISALEAKAR